MLSGVIALRSNLPEKQQFQRDYIFKQYLFNNNNSGKDPRLCWLIFGVQLNSYYYLKNLLAFLKKTW